MQVVEHVVFESKGSSDTVVDDVFGVAYSVKKVEPKATEAKEDPTPQPQQEDDLSSDLPF